MDKRKLFTVVVVALFVLSVGYGIFDTIRNRVSTKVLTQTKPLVKDLPTEVKVIPVVVVKKASAESRLKVNLPAGHSVTATADLKPSETGYGVLSVIDENTGVSTLQQYEKPRSAFGLPLSGRVYAGIGVGTAGQTAKIGAELAVLRVQDVYVSVEAEARTSVMREPELYGGVKADYRFKLW